MMPEKRRLERPAPPYLQIAADIKNRIVRGDLQPGRPAPSIRDIVDEYQVAIATAQRAMRALQAEGWVRAEPGVGNIVTTEAERGWSASAWIEKAQRTGRVYARDQRAEIVEAALADASEQVAGSLGVEVDEPAIRRVRITYERDQIVSASTSWFSGAHVEVAPKLLETGRIVEGTFVYLAVQLSRRAASWEDQYHPGLATIDDARLLSVPEGTPVNHGRNWIRDELGEVLEYGESVSTGRIMYRGEIDTK